MSKSKFNAFRLSAMCTASALALAVHTAAVAQAADTLDAEIQTLDFNIPAQPLGQALAEFGRQADIFVIAPTGLTQGKMSNALVGEYASADAVKILLDGTGVGYRLDEDGSLLLEAAARTEDAGEEDASGTFRGASVTRAAARNDRQPVEEVEADEGEVEAVPERDVITVTGTTIRGIVPESTPLDIYTAEDIALSGATTIERFLETLTQNNNSQTSLANDAVIGNGGGRSSRFQSSGVDLRGFGIGTTLVLLNGKRLTPPSGESVNTSLIPLGAIERIEVMPDGASAIYGSDAIGGVINFVLRDEFDGAELGLTYGSVTDGSHDLFQANASYGTSWSSGSAIASYSFGSQSDLDAKDREYVGLPDGSDLAPERNTHSIFGAVDQQLSERLSVDASVLYSILDQERDSGRFFRGAPRIFRLTQENEQVIVSGAASYAITRDLFFDLEAIYTDLNSNIDQPVFVGTGSDFAYEEDGSSYDLLAKLNGRLFEHAGGEVSFSIGGGVTNQEYRSSSERIGRDPVVSSFERTSEFLFAEVFAPIVGRAQNVPWVERLELSAAIRYTDYDDFGGASTPRFGLLWSPFEGLNVRGTYSRSFRAPTLSVFDPSAIRAQLLNLTAFNLPDAFSTDGSTQLLILSGAGLSEVGPEYSDSYSFGIDFEPSFIDNLSLSGTYFTVDYTDRLGTFISGNVLAAIFDPASFAFAFNENPDPAELLAVLSSVPASGFIDTSAGLITNPSDPSEYANAATVVLDQTSKNLAQSRVEGVDFSLRYSHDVAIGTLNYGANVTYTIDSFQRAIPSAVPQVLLDTVGNPTSLKMSANVGLTRNSFRGQLNVNYVDSYEDIFSNPTTPIESWTTVDLSLSYDFGRITDHPFRDAVVSLNVNNLFDEDPPSVGIAAPGAQGGLIRATGFDPVNANPIGRFVTVGVRKAF